MFKKLNIKVNYFCFEKKKKCNVIASDAEKFKAGIITNFDGIVTNYPGSTLTVFKSLKVDARSKKLRFFKHKLQNYYENNPSKVGNSGR